MKILHCRYCGKDKAIEVFNKWRRLLKRENPDAPATCKECYDKRALKYKYIKRKRYATTIEGKTRYRIKRH